MKRAFDILFSLVAIILTSPYDVALGVRLTPFGSVIFKQERVGLNRRNFMMFKCRSMRVIPEEENGHRIGPRRMIRVERHLALLLDAPAWMNCLNFSTCLFGHDECVSLGRNVLTT